MLILLAVYSTGLSVLGTVGTASWVIGALNFIGYMPVGLVWVFTVIGDNIPAYKRYYRWLIASNIYGWLLTVLNITWYLVLVLVILIFHVFDAGTTKPNIYLPLVGMTVELILQILYSVGFGKSKRLMRCWGFDYPDYGVCPSLENKWSMGDSDALFEVTITI
jgi:hypothetical protein